MRATTGGGTTRGSNVLRNAPCPRATGRALILQTEQVGPHRACAPQVAPELGPKRPDRVRSNEGPDVARVGLGQAAKLCGKTRVEFLLALPRAGVKVSNLSADDADDEISFARNA